MRREEDQGEPRGGCGMEGVMEAVLKGRQATGGPNDTLREVSTGFSNKKVAPCPGGGRS